MEGHYKLTREMREKRKAALEEAFPKSKNLTEACIIASGVLGVPVNTLRRWYNDEAKLDAAGMESFVPQGRPDLRAGQAANAAAQTIVEKRDEGFWRRRARELEERAALAEKLARELAGLAERTPKPPVWAFKRSNPSGSPARSVGLLHMSDLHGGERVDPEQSRGLNEYDEEVLVRRVRRYFDAAVEILPRWSADTELAGVVLAANGDLVSGDIHEELVRSNTLTSHEQVFLVADEITRGVEALAEAFGAVEVKFTPGNHARITKKPSIKDYARLSYDTMIGGMVARYFANDERVSVEVAKGIDLTYPILGWNVLQTHGDNIGTRGGQGFGGPGFPIIRGTKLIDWQASSWYEHYDLILTAHYHTSMNPGKVLANGSVVGYNEYAQSLRAAYDPPRQWLALIHEKWGMRERCDLALEDPISPSKTRVRVPAR